MSVSIHHLGCGTMCPRGRGLLQGEGGRFEPANVVCHVLLIEAPDALVLVDTGFGLGDARGMHGLARAFQIAVQARPTEAETAIVQIRELGFDPADVRHIVLTHADVDHSGGLPDFPQAEVHLSLREDEARRRPPRAERVRYAMGASHWAHGPRWVTHDPDGGERWFGFESVRLLDGVDAEVVMVPLYGHSLGHVGVAVRPQGEERWLLHCGDAYFDRAEVASPPQTRPALELYQRLVGAQSGARRGNQERLRELARAHGRDVDLICSHDPVLLDRLRARSAGGVGG